MSPTVLDRTYVMVKPDGVRRGLVGRILQRFEARGFQLLALKLVVADEALARHHYSALEHRPFFHTLIRYLCSGPVVCMCLAARDAAVVARAMIGSTNPSEAQQAGRGSNSFIIFLN